MGPATPPPRFDAAEVRRYYERHTRGFLAYGQGGRFGAIRRAVWGPGVTSRQEAFHYVDDRIVEALGHLSTLGRPAYVVDLGCGVGASLCHIAARLPVRGTGITFSPLQTELATRRIAAAGLADRVSCVMGDFCALPATLAQADAAYAIEAFVHSFDAARFFAEAARLVTAGGLLAICDDFLRETHEAGAAATVDRFRRGWRLNVLLTSTEARAAAELAGFTHESTTALAPWLELNRPRDRVLAALGALFGRVPLASARAGHLLGGGALHRCLVRGWIGYDLLLFRRTGQGGVIPARVL